MPKITVEMTEGQKRVFEALAQSCHAEPAEVVLALACNMACSTGHSDHPSSDLMGLCWEFAKAGRVPTPDQWLSPKEMEGLTRSGNKSRKAVANA